MKKTIIILGVALVAFANDSFASNLNVSNKTKVETIFSPTPLCTAILKGDFETIKKFIEYGADVNQASDGMTPLMLAARYNKVEIVKFLLDKGAIIDVENEKGYTALNYAQMSKAIDVLDMLKKA